MTRISLTEQYDDRDVIAQIVRLKQGLEDASGGIISDIRIVGNDLVIQWADGSSVTLPLPDPVTGISSITGSVSGGNLTITFYFTNGTTHAFTCPLTGMATTSYVDGLDAQNVKITGAQSVGGVKTFSDSPIVPDAPTDYEGAVNDNYVNDSTGTLPNNILHKDGNENAKGTKMMIVNKMTIGSGNYTGWYKLMKVSSKARGGYRFLVTYNNVPRLYDVHIGFNAASNVFEVLCDAKDGTGTSVPGDVKVAKGNDGFFYIFMNKLDLYAQPQLLDMTVWDYGYNVSVHENVTFLMPTSNDPEPVVGPDYTDVYTGTAMFNYRNGSAI